MAAEPSPGQISYEEALAQVTAPGQLFEVGPMEVAGREMPGFVNAPHTLKALFDLARGHGDKTFLVYEDERWSFDETFARVDALASGLVERFGVEPGDRVAIAMRNLPEWVVSFAAVTSIGAVSVSFNAWWVTEEIEYALDDAAPKVVIADEQRVERAAAACADRGITLLGVRCGALPDGVVAWSDALDDGAPMPEVDLTSDMDATILYTSGTTGHPKGAVSSSGAIMQALAGFSCRAMAEIARKASTPAATDDGADRPKRRPPVFILVVPLFHVTGCVPVMLGSFLGGYRLVMMHRWEPQRALELIEREQVTQFVGVPTQSWDLLECPEFARYDTSSLEKIGGGGAPAPPKLVRRVEDSFASGGPTIGYGMTETNAYGPQNTGDDYLAHPTSTGRGTPILSLEVRDVDGGAVPAGELGEIWMGGPHLIRGYWNRPEATAETIVDGWLRTGDLGRLDDDGFLYIEDRAKDMVLRGGENVYCAEVEAAVYEHPAVYEAAVYGLPHERLGEEVVATIRLKEGESLDGPGLRSWLSEHLAAFKIPSRMRFTTEELPRNASGKMLKRQMRDEDLDSY
ncbi:MAG: acyl--CoA ligase [Actinomycetia bacterium]|nr:acyl--CoA ligase [Actinomycetes bacterium]